MVMSLQTQQLPRKDMTHEDADRHELYRTECSYYILGEPFLPLSRASYSEAQVCKLITRNISSTFYSHYIMYHEPGT